MSYRISGRISEEETGRPLPNLVVRAFDKDVVSDDLLGFALTDADGSFEIRYSEADFRDVIESRPDVYLRVYDPEDQRLIHDTLDQVRRNAEQDERFEVRISGTRLVPR